MKIREQITRMNKNRKGWKYGAAGTICLVAAVCLIAALFGNRVNAERINLTVNGRNQLINFEVVDGKYQVKTADQLQAVGNATGGTADKTFVLTDDLMLGEVTSTAAGKFEGTFDGGGHVIQIQSVNVSNDTLGAAAQIEGILFGTVTGTVKNLIIDIEGNVSYERKSGISPNEETKTEPETIPSATYEDAERWSILDEGTQKAAAEVIEGLPDVYEDGWMSSTHYKKEVTSRTITKRTFYPTAENVNLGEDAFGILCGALDGGTISQVYIKGGQVTTSQDTETKNMPLEMTEITTETMNHYYKVEELEKEFTPVDVEAGVGSVSVSGGTTEEITSELQRIVPDTGNPYYELKIQAAGIETGSRLVFTAVDEGWTSDDTEEVWSAGQILDSKNSSLILRKETDEKISQVSFKVQKEEPAVKDEVEITIDNENVTGGDDINLAAVFEKSEEPATYKLTLTLTEDRTFIFTEVDKGWKIGDGDQDWKENQILDGPAILVLTKATTDTVDKVSFKLQEKYTKITPMTVTVNSGTVTGEEEANLEVNLEKYESENGSVYYLLKMTAGELGERAKLKFTKVDSDWSVVGNTGQSWKDTGLGSGEALTLKKTLGTWEKFEEVSFKVQKVQEYTAYSYEKSEAEEPVVSPQQISETKITYGNDLRAGAVSGISDGIIRETKLDIDVRGITYQPESGSVHKGMEVIYGTVAGKALSGELNALYLLRAGTRVGFQNETVKESEIVTLTDSKPDSGNWKTISYYTDVNTKIDSFDLAWLVKDAGFDTSAGGNSVTVTVTDLVRESDAMEYKAVYHARKSLKDAEFARYHSNSSTLALGESGYYRKEHLYATDGYYSYVKDYNTGTKEEPVYVTEYPYLDYVTENPINLTGISAEVVRNEATLEDQIVYSQLDLSKFGRELKNPLIYYTTSEDEAFREQMGVSVETANSTGSASFAFDREELKLYMTPSVNGKLYEISESDTFVRKDREELPKPQAVIEDDYDENGTPRTQKIFETGALYETGSMVNLNFLNAGNADVVGNYANILDIAYAYTTEEAGPEASDAVWKKYSGQEFKIPAGLQEDADYYLHVKVSKQFCDDVFVKFGPFKVVPGASAVPVFYYFDHTQDEAYKIEGKSVFRDDVLRLEVSGLNKKWKTVEYRISGVNNNEWQEYQDNEKIDIRAIDKNEKNLSIQIRMKRTVNGENIYGGFDTYGFVLAGQTAGANSSPVTTDSGMSGTSSILNSGTLIKLTSAASDARILYTISSEDSEEFKLERVLDPEETTNENSDYQYFQVGKRWYKTPLKSAKVYQDAEPIEVENMSADRIRQFVHTVVLSENTEPSEEISHEYLIEPMGTTAPPEASLETYTYPGNTDVPIASAIRNSFLTFSTLTSGAELYYTIDGTVPNDTVGGSTYRYDSNKGIKVEGVVGGTLTIKMRAVKYDLTTEDPNDKELLDSEVVTFTYKIEKQQEIPSPTAIPATNSDVPTVIVPGVKIILSSITKDSKIYYTTDGTSPQITQQDDGTYEISGDSTYLYDAQKGIDAPAQQKGYFIIRAVAAKTNLAQSPEAEFVYQFPGEVLAPYANVSAGAVKKGTAISLLSKTDGATIYYTISRDGKEPKDPTVSSSVFDETQPFVIDSHTIIKAIAVKNEVKSSVVTLQYTCMEQLETVNASIKSGSVVSAGTVLTLSATERSKIYYTLDGSDPTDSKNASVIIGNQVTLDGKPGDQITVKAYAKEEGKSDSEAVTFTYMISQSTAGVTADLPNGTYVSNGSKINLMTDVSDADIYYTIDGSDPKTYGTEGSVVTVRGTSGASFMIKAVAKTQNSTSMVVTFTYRIKEKPSSPSAAPSGGTLTVATRVELSASVEKIYYTTDGTTPTESSALYTEPILINRTTTLQAIAVSEDGEISDVSTFYYGAADRASTPTATEEDGSVLEPGTKIFLKTRTSGAQIYYTTDGSDPELNKLDSCLVYTEEGISVQRSVVIKAVAYRDNMQISKVGTYTYIVEIIPAVEIKKAEAEKLAAEGLQDTDASALERHYQQGEKTEAERTLVEAEYNTRIESSEEAFPESVVLVTKKMEPSGSTIKEVKDRYGEDFTIVSYYDIYVKSGTAAIQPTEEVELGIPVPKDYSDAILKVVQISDTRALKELPTRRENGMVYAVTSQFENYALVGIEETEEILQDINQLLIFEAAAGVAVVFGIGYFITQKIKNRRKSG